MSPAAQPNQNPAESLLLNAIRQNAIEVFLVAPTLPVTIFLRKSLGFRVLKPWVIYLGAVLLNIFAAVAVAGGASMQALALMIVDLAFVGLSIYWRYAAWGVIKRSEFWHTRSRGIPFLSILPLREDIVQRFVDPAICFALGLVLFIPFKFVGGWLMLSGLALLVLEQILYDQQLNTMLDQYDGIIDAKVVADNTDFFSGASRDKTPPTIAQSSGVAVVVAPELQEMIARRKAQKA